MRKLIVNRNMSQTQIIDVGKLTWDREGHRCCQQGHSRRTRSLTSGEGKASLTLAAQALAGSTGQCCSGQAAEQGTAVAGPGVVCPTQSPLLTADSLDIASSSRRVQMD